MNAILKALREANRKLISVNPVEIVVHRVELVPAEDGGFSDEDDYPPPFMGRIIPSRQQKRTYNSEAGELQINSWILIAPWDTDLKAGTSVTDAFSAMGKSWRVSRVTPRLFGGEIYSIHVALEEVS